MLKMATQWNDVGFCFRNVEVLRKAGMTEAAGIWQDRADKLMADLTGKTAGVHDLFDAIVTGKAMKA